MSVKSDLMKQIDALVKRKKDLAEELKREKTISHWAAEFFAEVEKFKNLDNDFGTLQTIELYKFMDKIRRLDRGAWVDLKDGNLQIGWSPAYITLHDCEPVMTLDAATAFFQDAMENLE